MLHPLTQPQQRHIHVANHDSKLWIIQDLAFGMKCSMDDPSFYERISAKNNESDAALPELNNSGVERGVSIGNWVIVHWLHKVIESS